MEQKLIELEKKVDKIMTNHLPHLEISLTKLSTDITWLKKFFWVVATASVGSLIAALFNLIAKSST